MEGTPFWVWIIAVVILAWGTLHYHAMDKVSLPRAVVQGAIASSFWVGVVTAIRSFLR